jgi:hypothetical protein
MVKSYDDKLAQNTFLSAIKQSKKTKDIYEKNNLKMQKRYIKNIFLNLRNVTMKQ